MGREREEEVEWRLTDLSGLQQLGEGEAVVPQPLDVRLGDLELLPVAVHHEERAHHTARVRVDAELLWVIRRWISPGKSRK